MSITKHLTKRLGVVLSMDEWTQITKTILADAEWCRSWGVVVGISEGMKRFKYDIAAFTYLLRKGEILQYEISADKADTYYVGLYDVQSGARRYGVHKGKWYLMENVDDVGCNPFDLAIDLLRTLVATGDPDDKVNIYRDQLPTNVAPIDYYDWVIMLCNLPSGIAPSTPTYNPIDWGDE
jgi:hypothetical protein